MAPVFKAYISCRSGNPDLRLPWLEEVYANEEQTRSIVPLRNEVFTRTITAMILCFTAQVVGCLTPRRRPSSTDVTPNFAVTIKWMAANQSVSGSLVPWRIVLAVGDVCLLQWLHW